MWKNKAEVYAHPSDSREILFPVKIFTAAQIGYASELSQFPSPPFEQLASGTHPSTGNPARILYPKGALWHAGKSQSVLRRLRLLALLNMILTWGVSILGYEAVCEERHREAIKWTVGLVSVAQAGVIGLHASLSQRWKESLRQELKLSPTPVKPLSECKEALALCIMESCFHLLVLPPGLTVEWNVHILGTHCYCTLDACLYVLLLLRNYHMLQYFFWQSSLTARRPALLFKVANVNLSSGFALRYCLSAHGLALMLGLYTATAVISCTAMHALVARTSNSGLNSVANSVWLVAMTQTTIGYGDITPKTLTCLAAILVCFLSLCSLSLLIHSTSKHLKMNSSQLSLYIAILYAHRKRLQFRAAALLLQAWWKLMHTRIHRQPRCTVVINFYSQQRKYRQILLRCNSIPYRHLPWEIQAAAAAATLQFKRASDSLQWIQEAKAAANDLVNKQYNIMHQIKAFNRRFNRRKGKLRLPVTRVFLAERM